MNYLELNFLFSVEFDLGIDPEEFDQYFDHLTAHALENTCAQHGLKVDSGKSWHGCCGDAQTSTNIVGSQGVIEEDGGRVSSHGDNRTSSDNTCASSSKLTSSGSSNHTSDAQRIQKDTTSSRDEHGNITCTPCRSGDSECKRGMGTGEPCTCNNKKHETIDQNRDGYCSVGTVQGRCDKLHIKTEVGNGAERVQISLVGKGMAESEIYEPCGTNASFPRKSSSSKTTNTETGKQAEGSWEASPALGPHQMSLAGASPDLGVRLMSFAEDAVRMGSFDEVFLSTKVDQDVGEIGHPANGSSFGVPSGHRKSGDDVDLVPFADFVMGGSPDEGRFTRERRGSGRFGRSVPRSGSCENSTSSTRKYSLSSSPAYAGDLTWLPKSLDGPRASCTLAPLRRSRSSSCEM